MKNPLTVSDGVSYSVEIWTNNNSDYRGPLTTFKFVGDPQLAGGDLRRLIDLLEERLREVIAMRAEQDRVSGIRDE